MREGFGCVLVTLLAGCGGGSVTGGLDDPMMIAPDAPPAPPASDAAAPVDRLGFQVVTPTLVVPPHSDIAYCYYVETPNPSELSVRRWESHMTEGAQQMILFLTPGPRQPAGTLTTERCGLASHGIGPVWSYATRLRDDQLIMPADDGTGNAVGQVIGPRQAMLLEVHLANPTGQPIEVRVELSAYVYLDHVNVTPAAPFVSYNTSIDLPAALGPTTPSTTTVTGQCSVPPSAKFYFLSTHTHKQAVRALVKDGTAMVFHSLNWAQPGQTMWNSEPFFSFETGNLSYQCEYENPNAYRIRYGDSTATDEVCVTIGFYFPARDNAGHFCLNSAMIY